jgi:hypothetical protein
MLKVILEIVCLLWNVFGCFDYFRREYPASSIHFLASHSDASFKRIMEIFIWTHLSFWFHNPFWNLKKKLITSISTRKKICALGPRISLLLKNYYIFSMECHAKDYFGNRLLVLKCLRLLWLLQNRKYPASSIHFLASHSDASFKRIVEIFIWTHWSFWFQNPFRNFLKDF